MTSDPTMYPDRIKNAAYRFKLAKWVDSPRIQNAIVIVILINAIVLGLETSPSIYEKVGFLLSAIDRICLVIFVLEILIKLIAFRSYYFLNSINWFDLIVVGVSLVPGGHGLSVLRSLRIFRVLRLFTVIPQLRNVLAAFLHAIPGLFSVIIVMAVFFYTMGVLTTNLFGEGFPEWFGTLGRSLYTLFQIMTLESWSMGVVRPVMEKYPWAWMVFIPFIIVATFTILNLFIGIIVSSMQEMTENKAKERAEEDEMKQDPISILLPDVHEKQNDLKETLGRLEEELSKIRVAMEKDKTV